MIKAVFIDFDNTLYSHNTERVPQSTIEAIHKAKENGVKVCLATGRSMYEMRDPSYGIKELNLDGYVLMNGQLCLDGKLNTVFDHPITGPALDLLVKLFLSKTQPIVFLEKDNDYFNYIVPKYVKINDELGLHRELGEYTGNPIYLAVAYVTKDEEAEFAKKVPGCAIKRWSDFGVDIISEGIDKAKTIDYFINSLGIKREECMAIGDSYNDMDMLKNAGVSVAMGNAVDDIKKIATYVTTDIDEDGIYNAFKHFELIKD